MSIINTVEKTLGDRIKEYRIASGWTQDQLAEYAHYSRSLISQWESNRSKPDIDTIIHLASIFRTDVNTLLGITPAPYVPLPDGFVAESSPVYGSQIASTERAQALAVIDTLRHVLNAAERALKG